MSEKQEYKKIQLLSRMLKKSLKWAFAQNVEQKKP